MATRRYPLGIKGRNAFRRLGTSPWTYKSTARSQSQETEGKKERDFGLGLKRTKMNSPNFLPFLLSHLSLYSSISICLHARGAMSGIYRMPEGLSFHVHRGISMLAGILLFGAFIIITCPKMSRQIGPVPHYIHSLPAVLRASGRLFTTTATHLTFTENMRHSSWSAAQTGQQQQLACLRFRLHTTLVRVFSE